MWEELWRVAPEPEKTFLQGLIQLAAAFHHYARGNRAGAQSLALGALEKLEKFPGDYYGIGLARLRLAVRRWLDAPPSRPACVPLPAPAIEFELG